jgi:hypothetical protein
MAPLLSRLGIDRSGFGFGRRFGVAGVAGVSAEYLYTGAQQTTLAVPLGTTTIKFAGVGAGGDSAIGNAPNYGSGGGGGGAANLSGYTINPASPYAGTTLYIGVGGPSAPRNTYVRTTSHSGPIIFENKSRFQWFKYRYRW